LSSFHFLYCIYLLYVSFYSFVSATLRGEIKLCVISLWFLQPPRLSPKDATKDGSKIPVPCSTATSTTSPTGRSSTVTSTAMNLPASRARRPSTLQYCLKATAPPRLAPPPPTPPTQQPDTRPTTTPDQEVDRPSTTVQTRQPDAAPPAAVWPTKIVAPKATPEDSLIDSCSTDGDERPEYRLLSLAGDEIGDHLRATAIRSHLDLLNSVSAPIADEDDDVDDDFDLSEGRPVELCRDELPPASVSAAAGGSDALETSSPDPFRYVDVLAARTVNSCDATGFPQRRPWPWLTAPGHDRLVGSDTSLPARLAVALASPPRQSRSSTLPRSAASLPQRAACGDSSSDADTLTPAASTRSSLSGIAAAATASTLTKKQSLMLSVGGAVGGESAGRLTATAFDSPTFDATARLSPDSPVSRFCHLGAHALDVFYSPVDDDDDDVDDAGVVSPLPASTAASGAGTFWRPVACTAAVDRRRRPSSPPSLSQLVKHRSPPTYRRSRLSSPPPHPPTTRPSAAPLVGVIEGLSDVECASISDEEDRETSTIRPPRPTGLTAAPSNATAQLSSTELQQSSRSCSKQEVSGSQSTWLTTPESSVLHRDGHSTATDTVWPAEALRPRYNSRHVPAFGRRSEPPDSPQGS